MKLLPTIDRVVVRPLLEDEQSAGLKIVRDNRNIEMQHGIIVAAGPSSTIPEGKRVLYNPAAGTLLRRLQGAEWEELRIMHSDTIQCVVEDD